MPDSRITAAPILATNSTSTNNAVNTNISTIEQRVRFNDNNEVINIDKELYYTRMQIRISLNIKQFSTQWSINPKLQYALLKLREIDNSFQIIKWDKQTSIQTDEETLRIKDIINLSEEQLKPCFPRIFTKPKGTDNFYWLDFHMGHTHPWNVIKDEIAPKLNKYG
jgi:hypothetical protein